LGHQALSLDLLQHSISSVRLRVIEPEKREVAADLNFRYSWLRRDPDIHAGHCGDEKAQILPQGAIHLSRSLVSLLYNLWHSCLCVSGRPLHSWDISTDQPSRYCGQYVASPSLASAGGKIEKIAFGISIPGFIMTSTLWVHTAAKFVGISHPEIWGRKIADGLLIAFRQNTPQLASPAEQQSHPLEHVAVGCPSSVELNTPADRESSGDRPLGLHYCPLSWRKLSRSSPFCSV
jgi:hypothetical protein